MSKTTGPTTSKVPRPYPGVYVTTPDNKPAKVIYVDWTSLSILVAGIDKEGFILELNMEDYNPAPTMNNFMQAIREWDYHYRASDDPRYYEEHREIEQGLIALLKALSAEDQHTLRKIVDVVVMSAKQE